MQLEIKQFNICQLHGKNVKSEKNYKHDKYSIMKIVIALVIPVKYKIIQ